MQSWLPLLGVVIAQFVLVALYFAKQRADDKRRWHENRLAAYRRLAGAARDAYEVLLVTEDTEKLDDRRLTVTLAEADACQLDIALLSSEPVRKRAETLRMLIELSAVLTPDAKSFPTTSEFEKARRGFEQAVRAELGIRDPVRAEDDPFTMAIIESMRAKPREPKRDRRWRA